MFKPIHKSQFHMAAVTGQGVVQSQVSPGATNAASPVVQKVFELRGLYEALGKPETFNATLCNPQHPDHGKTFKVVIGGTGLLNVIPKPSVPNKSNPSANIGWMYAIAGAKVLNPSAPLIPSDAKKRGPHKCTCDFHKVIVVTGCICGGC